MSTSWRVWLLAELAKQPEAGLSGYPEPSSWNDRTPYHITFAAADRSFIDKKVKGLIPLQSPNTPD